MIWSTKASRTDKARKKAQEDYAQAVKSAAQPDRDSRIFCVRVALKCRANLDTAFARAAREIGEYDEQATRAIAKGEQKPELPVADPFQLVKVGSEFVYTYIPVNFAEAIFAVGSAYQTLIISREQAIERAQSIANEMWDELGLIDKFEVLRFLRDDESAESTGTSPAAGDTSA
jgi:hypothetical protein